MEKQLITIEDFKLGRIYYGLEAEVYYYDNGEAENDEYPSCSELEVHSVEVGEIWAYDSKTDAHYEVTNEEERRLVIDSIDWEFELEKSL